MKTRIVKIGNSRGIRIPKVLLEQSSVGEEVELKVQNGQIVIRSAIHPRQGWEEAFQSMAEHDDDKLLYEDVTGQTRWDEDEWQW